MSQAHDVETLLLAHEQELPSVLRLMIRTLRSEVEHRFPEATSRQHLLLGAAVLRMILVSIEKSTTVFAEEENT